MAITKIHPIKSTLKAALDYIENPDKTDDKMLVSSFGCSYETADIEFQMLLAQAMNKGNNLAHHLIQAFEPGETTPEQAHEIGRQLADEVLQGKYPYVLTTHIDKGHLHNHIIFCAVDMVNCRKYVSNRRSYAYIRRTSDRLCRENGLSVVKPGKDKGKSYAEWDAQRKGKSWKAKLKITIDAAIPQAKDFDDFLRLMQAQGYEIKQGKFISFRAPGQERFTRCKTLGEDYTEEAITRRIKGLAVDRGPKRKAAKEITLRINLENSIKAQQSAGYARWAKVHNLKQAARTLNFLTEHGIDDYAELESKVAEISAANDEAAAALKGKVIEAISLIMEYNRQQSNTPSVKISNADLRALENGAAYINDHFNCDISVDQLSHITCMGRTKLKLAFKEVYGVSITEYIQQRRLSHAETLLSLTDFTIEQVAAAVGYNNAGRFASMFKKSTGVYPAEYRKMAQKK